MTKWLLVGVLAAAFLMIPPGQAYAGDDEWATAGKILAGVVGAKVLFDGWGHHHRHNARPVVTYRTYCPPPRPRVYTRTYYYPRRTVVYEPCYRPPRTRYRYEVWY